MRDLRTTGAVGLALAVIAALMPWWIGPASAVAMPDDGAAIAISIDRPAFSPNGDGRRDVVHVRFRLPAPGHARLVVRRYGEPVRTRIDLGPRPRGVTSWRFDGRDARGRTLPDSYYKVRVVARTARRTLRSEWAEVNVDTTLYTGLLRSDWPTVYPRTADFTDSVHIDHLGFPDARLDPARFVILDGSGARVARWAEAAHYTDHCEVIEGETYCGRRHVWDARRAGAPLPAGTYDVVMKSWDPAGNRRVRRLEIEVSAASLVARRASVQATADSFPPPPPDPGCNGCGEELGSQCGTVTTPGRFGPGSLRYASRDTCDDRFAPVGKHQAAMDHLAQRAPAAGYGAWTVTVNGGPSTALGPDVGYLKTGATETTLSGDGQVTSPSQPSPGDATPPVAWRFETRGTDSFDVAWFRVDYTYYAAP